MSAGDTEFKILHNAFDFVVPGNIQPMTMGDEIPKFEDSEKIKIIS